MKDKTFAEKLEPLMLEIEKAVFNYETKIQLPPNVSDNLFRSSLKLFMFCMTDRLFKLQQKENISIEDGMKMVLACGEELKLLVKKFTDIDTTKLYN